MLRFLGPLLVALVAACGQQQAGVPEPTAVPQARDKAQGQSIAWFEGDVQEALSLARAQGKPVFLYWGAQWCPPCNQIKSTIFVREDFIQRSRQFIAVYLDGDSAGAQRWGEHFGTAGYPTLIVLQPDGTELTRISSGMDAARYPQVLDLALARNRPARALLQSALSQPETLTDDDWTLLSLYSWSADNARTVSDDALPSTLLKLAELCPESSATARDRLRLLGTVALLDRGEDPPDDSRELLSRIALSEPLSRQNLTELQYYGADLLAATTTPGSAAREALAGRLSERMQAVFADASLPVKQRLLSTRLLLDLAALQDQQDSPAMQALVRERAAWADQHATTPYLRQSLIYNAAWYLHEAGLSQQALEMFEAELQQAVSPHYYMSYLALIEEDLGHHDKALAWSRRAWEEARGPATRTQWGTAYARKLMSLSGDEVETIAATVEQLLNEMESGSDGFYQRSMLRMQRLNRSLQQWAEEDQDLRLATAVNLRLRLQALCLQDQEDAASCAEFSGA